jgi:serine/threonine protein phosphatase PrpC
MEVAGLSVQGGGRENQDTFYHGQHPHDESVRILLLLDGHGQFGRTAAVEACRYLRTYLELASTLAALRQGPAAALSAAFEGAHLCLQDALRRAAVEQLGGQAAIDQHRCPVWRPAPELPWKCIRGGSTATAAVWLDSRWVVAQAGDSDVLWLQGEEHRVESPDHSPASEAEMARLVRDHAGEDGMPTARLVYDIKAGRQPLWADATHRAPPPPGHFYKVRCSQLSLAALLALTRPRMCVTTLARW